MASKSTECNWALLFDIALSHGTWINRQKLLYRGFLSLMRSAGIIGPKTGVYPVLLEALWQLHGKPRNAAMAAERTLDDIVVDFDGFLAVMNVVCVRCFQTQRCSELIRDKKSIAEAITLSAEDQIRLKESVGFTARHFFKPLINRYIVTKNMIVSLDSMKNDWTPYVNQLLSHIFAAAADSVVGPLFSRYAKNGCLNEEGYQRFVDDVFPAFTNIQRKSAFIIFHYQGFHSTKQLIKNSILKALFEKARTLEIDSFAEAMIMLGIVAFSNEAMHLHHRPLTAKVWSVFENYYCHFLGVPMIEDPILDGRYLSILPKVSLIFPSTIPIDKVSSFLVGGWNLTVDECIIDPSDLQRDCPPRILNMSIHKKGNIIEEEEEEKEEEEEEEQEEEEEEEEEKKKEGDVDEREKKCVKGGAKKKVFHRLSQFDLRSPAGLASTLFEETFDRSSHAEYNMPIYGMRLCTVFVNEHRTTSIQRGPNRAEVLLPECMWSIPVRETRIQFVENEKSGRLLLTPLTTARVSLRDESGETVYSAKDVVLTSATVIEHIPPSDVHELRAVFDSYATECYMPLDSFPAASVALWVGPLMESHGGSQCVLADYARQRDGPAEAPLSFAEFVAAIAMVFLHQSETSKSLPNIPYLLGVALSRNGRRLPPLADGRAPCGVSVFPRRPSDPPLPHNARIDVPYAKAIRHKAASSIHQGKVEDLLRDFGKGRSALEVLPDFPSDLRTRNVVSQFDNDDNGLLDKVKLTSTLLRDAFLKKEMVVCRHGWKID